jgi:hypothetical protein
VNGACVEASDAGNDPAEAAPFLPGTMLVSGYLRPVARVGQTNLISIVPDLSDGPQGSRVVRSSIVSCETMTLVDDNGGTLGHGVLITNDHAFILVEDAAGVSTTPGLYLWTEALGLVSLGSGATYEVGHSLRAAASTTRNHLFWFDNASLHDPWSPPSTGDLVVANGNLSDRKVLSVGVRNKDMVVFAGESVVLSKSLVGAPAGEHAVAVFAPPQWSEDVIASDAAPGLAIDASGSRVAFITVNGDLRVRAVQGGPVVEIASGVGEAGLLSDGETAYYRTTAGELWRSPVGAPAPQLLQPSGVSEFVRKSDDDRFLALSTLPGDLYLASLDTASPKLALNAGSGTVVDSVRFTADSQFVIHALNTGEIYATATKGSAPVKLPTSGAHAFEAAALGGSRIVVRTQTSLELFDLATSVEPSALAMSSWLGSCADGLTACVLGGGTKLGLTANGAVAGLYVLDVP